jgi:hypothetical protein
MILELALAEGRLGRPPWNASSGNGLAQVSTLFRTAVNDLRMARVGARVTGKELGFRRVPIPATQLAELLGGRYDTDNHTLFADQPPARQALITQLCEILNVDDFIAIPIAVAYEQTPAEASPITARVLLRLNYWHFNDDADADEYRDLRAAMPALANPPSRETLFFKNLNSMFRYFSTGPGGVGQGAADLRHVRWVSVMYGDKKDLRSAWDAFEALRRATSRLSLEYLHVGCLDRNAKLLGPDSPGLWGLLKLRGLKTVFLTGFAWGDIRFNQHVRDLVTSPAATPWRPCGQELLNVASWQRVRHRSHEQQVRFLERTYRARQSLLTGDRRRSKERARYRAKRLALAALAATAEKAAKKAQEDIVRLARLATLRPRPA